MSHKMYTKKNESFKIICKKCNSDNTETGKVFWYDFEEHLTGVDSIILCKNCGYEEEI